MSKNHFLHNYSTTIFRTIFKGSLKWHGNIFWSRMGFSYSTSFVFEYLSNLTTQLQEKSANHAQPKSWRERKYGNSFTCIISLPLFAVVLFGSIILYTPNSYMLLFIEGWQSFPLQLVTVLWASKIIKIVSKSMLLELLIARSRQI